MRPKLPKSVAKIPIPLYGGTVWLAASVADAHICASLIGQEVDLEAWDGWTAGAFHNGERIYFVGMKRPAVDVLAHELCHVTFAVLSNAGVPTTHENDEAFCYLLQHLMAAAAPHIKA